MRLPHPPLLLITDRHQARRPLPEVVEAALKGGCRWFSLREKDLPPDEQIALARAIRELAAPYDGARVTLHGDAALALEAGVHGAHLPANADVAAARALLGPHRWLGVSTHREDGIAAAAAGADAVILSPIFASASKPGYGPALGIDRLAALAARAPLPVIALGGLDAGRARACLEAGAAAVAVMGEVMRAADPGRATSELVDAVLPRRDQGSIP